MLGISVYPYKENEEETLQYIEKAANYGFKRLFTNLLMIEKENQDYVIRNMSKVVQFARDCGMEVIIDINPSVFDQLGISYQNLDFFKKMGATGIRLDSTFDGLIESLMTFDSTDLDLEINISNDTYYLENILSYQPNTKKIIGCHNFYPQRYTGLDYEYFIRCSEKYKKLGIRTAAFVNSQNASHGPHPYTDGLCTLEMHRDLPIEIQAKHLIATQLIDDIIIANAFASEEELKKLSELSMDQIEFSVKMSKGITNIEKEIILNHQHFNRGDINSYTIRSTYVKLKYLNQFIPQNNANTNLEIGDITIGNDDFGQYKAELNIVKKEILNNKKEKNVVGRIIENELFLIPYIRPWTKFRFKEVMVDE